MRATTAAVALVGLVLFAAPARATQQINRSRAVASFVAMERYLFDPATRSYRETYAWPVSQAVSATIAVARIPGARTDAARFVAKGLNELAALRQGPLYHAAAGAPVYYDDNEWIAQDLLDWNLYRRDRTSVGRAAAIFAAVVQAWDGDASTPCAGGVYWTTELGNSDRNTVTTANGAVVGLRLYVLTGDPSLLDWSRRMLEWTDACMHSPDGLYWDHIDARGAVDRTEWTYNQGALVSAYLTLYQATGDASALARAEQLADAALHVFNPARLAYEPPEFAAIFFDRLLDLAAVDGNAAYIDAAEAYAASAWDAMRDPATGLFHFRGSVDLLGQSAFVQLYAHLALTETEAGGPLSLPREA